MTNEIIDGHPGKKCSDSRRDDENVVVSTNQGEPLVGKNTMAGQAFKNISLRLLGEDIPLLAVKYQKKWYHRLTHLFARG